MQMTTFSLGVLFLVSWFLFSDETLDCPVKEINWLGSGELRNAKLDIFSWLKRGK